MPLYFQQHIDQNSRLGIWKITEEESFFLNIVSPVKKIAHPHKRLQHLAAYYLLQRLEPGFPMDDIRIDVHDKPFLLSGDCFFSLAHSGDFAAVIVSKERPVGIDIEAITEKPFIVRHKFLKVDEMILLETDHDLPTDFTTRYVIAWSLKEAVYKCGGNGSISLKNQIDITQADWPAGGRFRLDLQVEDLIKTYSLHAKIIENLCLAWVLA